MARLMAERCSRASARTWWWRTGGGGASIPGMEAVMHAAPDGYTLGMASSLAINPSVMSRLAHDVERDFAPIALIFTTPLIAVAHSSLPYADLAALVAAARAAPGSIDYASGGPGSSLHLAAEASAARRHPADPCALSRSGPAMADLDRGQCEADVRQPRLRPAAHPRRPHPRARRHLGRAHAAGARKSRPPPRPRTCRASRRWAGRA